MFNQKSFIFFIFLSLIFFLNGCNNETSFNNPNTKTEILVDSVIVGVDYINIYQNSTTNDLGEFTYRKNTNVIFKIGHAILGTINSIGIRDDNKRFIQELTGVTNLRDTNNSKTINLAVFLQSLDEDSDLSNGILISSTTQDFFENNISTDIDIQDLNESELNTTIILSGKFPKSRIDALNHLNNTMTIHGVDLTPPTVSSITLLNSPSPSDTTIKYKITFSENVKDISLNDFNLTFTDTTTASISSISKSNGSSIEVTINNIQGDGTLKLNLLDNHQIKDIADNSLIGGYTDANIHLNNIIPYIINVTNPLNGTYKENDNLDFTITINENIYIHNNIPQLTLNINHITKYVSYIDGNGTNTLLFRYIIENGLEDMDGIELENSINLNGSSIQDLASNNIITTFNSNSLNQVKIDSINPTITSIILMNSPNPSDTTVDYKIIFDEDVKNINLTDFNLTFTGTTTASINSISSTSGNNLIININNISQDGTLKLNLKNTHTIKDIVGNNLIGGYTNADIHNSNVLPYILDITKPIDNIYIKDDYIDFNITTSENINITGVPRLTLTINASTKWANYLSGDGTSNIIFRYIVENNLEDTDGISLANNIDFNGGTIKDIGNNDLNSTFTPPTLINIKIDSIDPYITSLTIPSDGYHQENNPLTFILNSNENITITNNPYLKLTIDGVEKNATYQSNTLSSITFNYNIENNIEDKNGIDLNNTIFLNSGSIKDIATNDINTTFTVPDLSNILVDSKIPQIINISNEQNGTHKINTKLDFNLTINEEVNITGTPRIALSIDGTTNKYISYIVNESNSTNLVFRYIIENNIEDLNGISLSTTINLNGSYIRDLATNDINLTIPNIDLSSLNIDSKAPIFNNNSTVTMCENKIKIIQISATDTSTITYTKQTTLDGNRTTLDGTNFLLFNPAPDFENRTDDNNDSIYKIIVTASDAVGNETNQTITVNVTDQEDETSLYIKDIVYDNNLTDNNVSDDTVYIYFSKPIDENSLELNNLNDMFTINNTGNFTNATASYSETLFNSIKISQTNGATALVPNDTNISIKPNTIKDKCGVYPTDFNQTVVSKFEYVLKTSLGDPLYGYDNDGNAKQGIKDDGYWSDLGYGDSRNFTQNIAENTVIDHTMQLIWQDDTNTTILDKNFTNAINFCNTYSTVSYLSEWRLPTIQELNNIIYYLKVSKWTNTDIFNNDAQTDYWSSSSQYENNLSDEAWKLDFNTGYKLLQEKSSTFKLRCVHDK